MTEDEIREPRVRKGRRAGIAVLGAVAAVLIGYGLYSAGVHAERQRVLRAEAARAEAILAKPLAEWTLGEREEFAAEYEARRARERDDDPSLWTGKEKRGEWWRYTKLVTRKTIDGWKGDGPSDD